MKVRFLSLFFLLVAATTQAADDVGASPPERKWEVYVLMHSHNDIGYTDIQPNIAKKQAHNVVRALELIEKTKNYPPGARFKWNLEVLMPYEDFKAVATPDQMRQFEQAVREGNIGIDAMYGNLLTGVCRQEELLRQFSFGVALGRRCGVKVDSMMISDVPGLTWGVVPALVQNGVKYISDGPNANPKSMEGDRIGYVREQWEHKPFWWQSPSGRDKVLYWGAQGGYSIGHGWKSITARAAVSVAAAGGQEVSLRHRADALDEGRQRPARRGGDGPRARLERQTRLSAADHRHDDRGVPCVREALRRQAADVPRRHDALLGRRHGLGSARDGHEPAFGRPPVAGRDDVGHAATRVRTPRPISPPHGKMSRLWDEHTWGAHNSISQPELPFVKDQWKYKQAYALDAQRQADDLALAGTWVPRCIATKRSREGSGTTCALGKFIAFAGPDIYNTSSWPRTELISAVHGPR